MKQRKHSSFWECFTSLFYSSRNIIWVNSRPYVCYYSIRPWNDPKYEFEFYYHYEIKCLGNARTWQIGDRYFYGLKRLRKDLKEDLGNFLSY